MQITAMTIKGPEGTIEITRTSNGGANITRADDHRLIACVEPTATRESDFYDAQFAAAALYGTDRKGRVNATNSMVHEVLDLIDRVAGR
ncbi:MAG: hypothetical protein KF768_14055 [Phycisphaeraceae bacterium]|nr:hypothetical protein [Phycisphaeraceae bacterium]